MRHAILIAITLLVACSQDDPEKEALKQQVAELKGERERAAVAGRAKNALHKAALGMEEHYGKHGGYVGATDASLRASQPELAGHRVHIIEATDKRFEICVNPIDDTACRLCFDSDVGKIDGSCG